MEIAHGDWSLNVYQWHSVNLVPCATAVPITKDESPKVSARALELIVFGTVVVVQWPSQVRKMKEYLRPRGAAWSRRRKQWYSLP